jgi:hypothetical protein
VRVGGELEVAHQRGPAGEAVAARHRQLCVVQGERIERDVRAGVMPPDHGERFAVGCGNPTLQCAGVATQPLERRIVGQGAGHDGLLS